MPELSEPSPLWPEAPRYCPSRELPPYRFMPGYNPHPNRDPEGHAYGQKAPEVAYMPPERWHDNRLYLYGVDLYNAAYFWEAHEAWEVCWKKSPLTPLSQRGRLEIERQFLQGLIQNSAAQLKRHLHQWPGMAHLSQEAYRRLQSVAESELHQQGLFMGLNVTQLLEDMKEHYQSVWNHKGAEPPLLDAPPPVLSLSID